MHIAVYGYREPSAHLSNTLGPTNEDDEGTVWLSKTG
jgi:hypothetical protein